MIKKILLSASILLVFMSCEKKSSQRILTDSFGNTNELTIVVDNDLWEGSLGDSIRSILAAPVDGLPREEPMFTLNQIPPSVFTNYATQGRIILKIENEGEPDIKYMKDVFATPQRLILVKGSTNQQIVDLIKQDEGKIIGTFKNQEIKEKQRRISLSLLKDKRLEEKLGIKVNFPSVYRVAKDVDNFFWFRKDITTGTLNVMIFELPLGAIKENDSMVNQITKMRDSIGEKYIPGPTDGSFMITEKKYSPIFFTTEIEGKNTYVTKGTWEVENAFMAGPYVNYVIEDKPNNRLLVMEGFAFAPSVEQREYMFELEAIIKSVKFLNEKKE
ncbi:MAG: DUF4837 family protein [Flavobacteriaceae bacterium]